MKSILPQDVDIYTKIIKLNSLYPSPKTNRLFAKLFKFAINQNNKINLKKRQLSRLQHICSEAEYNLEKHWAKKIIASNNPENVLKKFPYLKNYNELTKIEWHLITSIICKPPRKILFVGGGPLPLTAIILAKKYAKKITVLEKNREAYEISKKILNKLKLENKIEIVQKDAINFDNYKKYKLIIIASLAGIEKKEKIKIFKKIKSKAESKTNILARSSWGTRKILYKPIEKDCYKILKPIIEIRPQNEIVNSTIIFSKT